MTVPNSQFETVNVTVTPGAGPARRPTVTLGYRSTQASKQSTNIGSQAGRRGGAGRRSLSADSEPGDRDNLQRLYRLRLGPAGPRSLTRRLREAGDDAGRPGPATPGPAGPARGVRPHHWAIPSRYLTPGHRQTH